MQEGRIIVVGAGIGGLAAALRLASAGRRVTVLEAHVHLGGKMRTLPSAAGPVDAGPTVLTLRHVFDDLFSAAGARLDDHVTLTADPVLARHFWPDGSTLDLTPDPQANRDAIQGFAGARAARQFQRFDTETRRLYDTMDAPVMQASRARLRPLAMGFLKAPATLTAMAPGQSLRARLARRFDDPRLAQLFGRYATYVGGTPGGTPALLSLIWQAEARGVWRIEGGLSILATAVARLARFKGAEILTDTPARRIETRAGRPAAVIDAAGDRHACAAVVFAGDPRAIATGALGPSVTRAVALRATEPRSLSADVHAFAATPSRGDLSHHNVFFGADPDTEFGPIRYGQPPTDPTVYVCAQDRGAGPPPPLERFETIVNAPPLPTDGEPAPCPQTTFEALSARGLTFSPTPGAETRTTPQGFATLFPGSLGALYGLSPEGATTTFRRPTARTAIPGLYLAGGGVHPGAGVPMAALSGRHAAEAIAADLPS